MSENIKQFTFTKSLLPEIEEMKKQLDIKDDKTLFNLALELIQKKLYAEKNGLELAVIDRKNKEFYTI